MKYLVLTLCVCVASAATIDYKPFGIYKPVQSGQYQPQVPVLVGAKSAYTQGKYVASTPFTTKPVYNPGQYVPRTPVAIPTYNKIVAAVPVVPAKKTYSNVEVVPETPVVNTKTYEAVEVVAPVTVDLATPVLEAAQVVAAAPVVAEPVYKAVPVVTKPVYSAPKTVYNTANEVNTVILRSENKVDGDGYQYGYETSNGITAQAYGSLKNVDNTNVLVSEGFYQYPAADGTLVKVSYIADENGYQPRSDLLPVAPPIPEAILRSLEYIRTHPAKPENY